MTSPGKNAPGLVGFPTPDNAAGVAAYLLFLFPDPLWAQYILGACENLTYPNNWYESGEMSVDAAAEAFRVLIEQAPYNLTDDKVPAPFWDDTNGDDIAAEADPATQDWYGTWDGETFTETLAYTFLTNFLSKLITPGAAIKFLTIPRAFRVLIRQNPHGANLLLFLDGGLYKLVNGYSPVDQVAEILIASPGTEMMLVVDDTHDPSSTPDENGNYVVDVIRSRLSESDVTNTDVRYSGTPPVFQTTYDNGTTWVDTPAADVRHAPYAQYPHLTHYTGIECDTAARMTAQLKASIDLMCSVADAAQAVTGLLELILLPTGLVGALLSLFFTICDWVIDNGQATILAAFTTTVYHDIECALFCHIEADGSITQVRLDNAWDQVKALHPGTVATVIDEVRFLFTDNIFTNAGVKRTETGDCSTCDTCGWCYRFEDGTGFDTDWTVEYWTVAGCGAAAVFSGGVWNSTVNPPSGGACGGHYVTYLHLRKVLASTIHLTDAALHISDTSYNRTIWVNGDGSLFSGTEIWNGAYLPTSPVAVTSIDILCFLVDVDGAFTVDWAQFSGNDTDNPFGANNC